MREFSQLLGPRQLAISDEGSTLAAMQIKISHPNMPTLEGFRFFWGMAVTGFKPETHCLASLKGRRLKEFKAGCPLGSWVITPKSNEEIYLCGVAEPSPEVWNVLAANFHLVLRADPSKSVQVQTYNGYSVQVQGASQVTINPLPQGWNGLPSAFTRCRNFQYGVQRFGYPTALTQLRQQ